MGSELLQNELSNYSGGNLLSEKLDSLYAQMMVLLKQKVKPEFLNRIDDILMFTPLSKDDILKIVGIQISNVAEKLLKQGVRLNIEESAINRVAEIGFDPQFGARPIKRAIQKNILDELAKLIIMDDIDKDKQIVISFVEDKFIFNNK